MLGDVEDTVKFDLEIQKQAKELENSVIDYITQQNKCREVCKQIFIKYHKVAKIKAIYCRPKGSKYEYYKITIEGEN